MLSGMVNPSGIIDAHAIYLVNLDYDAGGGDTSKAEAFIGACRAILAGPAVSGQGGRDGQTSEYDLRQVSEQLQTALRWRRSRRGRRVLTLVPASDFRG